MFVEAIIQRCSLKKVFLEISQNSQESICQSLFLIKRKETFFNKKRDSGTGVFCEFFEISKNTFLHRTHPEVASMLLNKNVANFTGI